MKDPYLYDDVRVLRNKLNIKDNAELEDFENEVTEAALFRIGEVKGNFDFEHLKAMHTHIIEKVYEWAGKERTVDMGKSERVLNGLSVEYSHTKNIARDAKRAIESLNNVKWDRLSVDDKAKELAVSTAALWQSHPFREGNTRTVMNFICEFAEHKGFPLNKDLFTSHPAYVRDTLVLASAGQYSEYKLLTQILKDGILQGAEKAKINANERSEQEPLNDWKERINEKRQSRNDQGSNATKYNNKKISKDER